MPTIAERNRQNAKSSTGPRTPQGLARSSQNALKTGLFSVSALLASEDLEEYLAHAKSYVDCLKPQDPVQADLIKIYSDDVWRLRRIRGLVGSQHALMEDLMVREADGELPVKMKVTQTRILESFSRHEQRVRNAMAKTLKTFMDLKKQMPQAPELEAPEPEAPEIQDPEAPESGFVPSPENATTPDEPNHPQSTPETTPNQPVSPAPQDQESNTQPQNPTPEDQDIESRLK